MGYIVRMPQMGMEMDQGEVVEWQYDEGDDVEEGDVIAVVESEKAANDVGAREDGRLRRIVVGEGDTAEPGDPIGIVAGPDEDLAEYEVELEDEAADADADAGATADASGAAAAANADDGAAAGGSAAGGTGSRGGAADTSADEVRATPGARQRAEEADLDLTAVEGTGPQGVITEDDVEHYFRDRGTDDDGTAAASVGTGAGAAAVDADAAAGTAGSADAGATTAGAEAEALVAGAGVGPDAHDATAAAAAPGADEVRASPGARRLAGREGVDLTAVDGTGPEDVITEADVRATLEAVSTPAARTTAGAASGAGDATRTVTEARELGGIQQTVSERLGESYRNAVHVTVKRTFDAGTMVDVAGMAEDRGVDASLTDLLLKGVGETMTSHPAFNALFEGGEHRLVEEVNVGVAVDVDGGLVTPVVPDVRAKSAEEVAAVRGALTERTLAGEFTSEDLAGGTFTVTNLGMFGVDSFDPVINPPETAILGVGRVRENGTMTLSLSFDHRVVNGADAARYLDDLVGTLTDPGTLVSFFDADLFA